MWLICGLDGVGFGSICLVFLGFFRKPASFVPAVSVGDFLGDARERRVIDGLQGCAFQGGAFLGGVGVDMDSELAFRVACFRIWIVRRGVGFTGHPHSAELGSFNGSQRGPHVEC